ncbi:MAG: NUDIX domain-containing protein [Deinococcales bacterium]
MQHLSTELFDVLDEEGIPTGKVKSRQAVHQDGDWHRSIHIWILKEKHYILMQRRSQDKDLEAGKIDVSIGGHYQAGESFQEVLREAEEELGLSLSPKDLYYLTTHKSERHYEKAIDREFQEVYLSLCDQDLTKYRLNAQEIDVLYEIPLDKLITLYETGEAVLAAGYDAYERTNNALLILDDVIAGARQDTLTALYAIRAWLEPEQS